MPKTFKKHFRIQGCTAHVRKRTEGEYRCSYEIRYAKKPYNNPPISASGTTIEEAKARFIEKLNSYVPQDESTLSIPKDFHGFALYWFENFHRAKVVEKTYKNNLALYKRHVEAKLKGRKLSDITPIVLKELLTALPGNGKTTDDVYSLLNQILKLADKNKLIRLNPLDMIYHNFHETESGVDLTRTEELMLMNEIKGLSCEIPIALMLYAGLRPNEVSKAHLEGSFVVSINSKRKGGKIEYKKIPISSHLQKYIECVKQLEIKSSLRASRVMRKLLPNHTLKDLRKTFYTRCVECKVDFIAREMYMGHSLGKLQRTYTGNVDDFLLSEAVKLEEWYTLSPKITPKKDS